MKKFNDDDHNISTTEWEGGAIGFNDGIPRCYRNCFYLASISHLLPSSSWFGIYVARNRVLCLQNPMIFRGAVLKGPKCRNSQGPLQKRSSRVDLDRFRCRKKTANAWESKVTKRLAKTKWCQFEMSCKKFFFGDQSFMSHRFSQWSWFQSLLGLFA